MVTLGEWPSDRLIHDVLPVGQGGTIRMAGLPFRRIIKITQNATRAAKRKSQAFKSGSNQTADTQLAVHVRGKIGDKCLVMRLRFAVIREFCF